MKEIMLINPRRRKTKKRTTKRKAATKCRSPRRSTRRITTKRRATKRVVRRTQGVKTMAKRKKARKTTRRYRRNPSKARSTGRRVVRRSMTGLNFKSAFKNVLMLDVGMFAAKFAAKRFGSGATETDPNSWSWRGYLQAGAGAAVAGMVMNMVKPGTGQKVLEGGLAYVTFKAIQNELIAGHPTAESWLGADMPEDELLLDLDGTPYMNYDGVEYPLDESHRMGDTLVPVGRLGDTLVPVGRLGDGMGDMSNLMSAYKNAYRE